MEFIIGDTTVLPMTERGKIIRHGCVHVRNGKIEEVSKDPRRPEEGLKYIDGSRLIVMPGLFNNHVHLVQTLIRGVCDNLPLLEWLKTIYRMGKTLTPEDCYHAARLGCLESIRSGTTTIVDHHFVFKKREIADAILTAYKDMKMRGFMARGMVDTGAMVPTDLIESPDEILRDCDGILSRHSHEIEQGRLGILAGPNLPGLVCTPTLLKEVKEFSLEKKIRISTHISETEDANRRIREQYGFEGMVEFLRHLDFLGPDVLGAHCVVLSPVEMEILRESQTRVVHNPVSNMFLADGIAPVAEMLRKGIPVSLGTDSTAANNSQDMFEVMKMATLLQRVGFRDATLLPPWEVLEMATLHGARALGLENELGSLEKGKKADLIGIDFSKSPHAVALHNEASQIVHCARPSDVKLVVIDGEIVMEGGRMADDQEETILREGQRAGLSLVKRMFD